MAASHARNLAKTAIQAVVMWGMALGVLPVVIDWATAGPAFDAFRFTPRPALGWTTFALASCGGIWSAATMAVLGRGTPLPLDHPRELVVAGPYAYIRNPMAVFGLLQGSGIAMVLGSWIVLAYVAVGGALWNFVARPLEEAQLVRDFGEPYLRYRREVLCWKPRFRRYRRS